jgi:uncharacterized glyoxalase superfamily protein PhnB
VSDPFDALREPLARIDPRPAFAANLRARLTRALSGAQGGAMTMTTTTSATHYPTLTPGFTVEDTRRALDWYVEAFGAERRGEPIVDPDGGIGHAELAIGDSVLMVSDGPRGRGDASHSIFLRVPDADAAVAAAVGLGAELERPVVDEPYGRTGVVIDPFGHRWIVSTGPVP